MISPDQDGDMIRKLRQEQALFGRAVAAAYHNDPPAFIKGAVASGAKMYSGSDVFRFANRI